MTPEERLLRTAEAEMQVYGKVLSAEARPAYEARVVKSRAGTQETEVPPIAPANVRAVQDGSDATPRAGDSPATRRALSNDDEREADTQVAYVPETRRRVAHGDTAGQDDPGTGAVGPSAAQPRLGGDGLFVVGLEIMPGVYRTPGPAGSRDGSVALLRSTSTRDVMDFNMVQGPFTITVGPGVKAVKTSRCQPWHRLGDTLEAAIARASGGNPLSAQIDNDGLFVVGLDIMPGVYRTPGPAGSRDGSVALLRSTSTRDVMDFNMVQGPFTITVGPGVKAVKTSRCQPWHRLGDTLEAAVAGVPRPTSPRRT